jgi:hypothetical protein
MNVYNSLKLIPVHQTGEQVFPAASISLQIFPQFGGDEG